METILRFEHVSLVYQSVTAQTVAVKDLSFDVGVGEFVAIVGPSGCGKSTLLSMAAGLIAPTMGRVLLNGQPVCAPRGEVGYMLQRDYLFEWRSIWQNALLGLHVRGRVTKEDKQRVYALIKTCELEDFMHMRPSALSGGMRQRAALIRTLALNPKVLLLDEPFSALDYQTRLTLGDELCTLIRREQKTALFVTHDISEAISIADRVVVLSKRPSFVREIIPIHLAGQTPLARRSDPAFRVYFDKIWKEMEQDAS